MKIFKSLFFAIVLITVMALPSFAFNWGDLLGDLKPSTETTYSAETAYLRNLNVGNLGANLATGVCSPHLFDWVQSNGRAVAQLISICGFGTASVDSTQQSQFSGSGGIQIIKSFGFDAGVGADVQHGGWVVWAGFNPVVAVQTVVGGVQTVTGTTAQKTSYLLMPNGEKFQ